MICLNCNTEMTCETDKTLTDCIDDYKCKDCEFFCSVQNNKIVYVSFINENNKIIIEKWASYDQTEVYCDNKLLFCIKKAIFPRKMTFDCIEDQIKKYKKLASFI